MLQNAYKKHALGITQVYERSPRFQEGEMAFADQPRCKSRATIRPKNRSRTYPGCLGYHPMLLTSIEDKGIKRVVAKLVPLCKEYSQKRLKCFVLNHHWTFIMTYRT